MRLLTIDCSNAPKLAIAITAEASKLYPKPEMISTMNLNLDRFNVPEFKTTLFNLAPDTIILNPPCVPAPDNRWAALLKETARQVEISSGRVLFISSVDVLGDSSVRTEAAIEMPYSEMGIFLQPSETTLEESTSRCYIIRFPWLLNSISTKEYFDLTKPEYLNNLTFTLAKVEDMARIIIERVQTGWFGKFHATPNDSITLSDVLPQGNWNFNIRVPDHSLQSRYLWSMTPSKIIWDEMKTW